MQPCSILAISACFLVNVLIASRINILSQVKCIYKGAKHCCLRPQSLFISATRTWPSIYRNTSRPVAGALPKAQDDADYDLSKFQGVGDPSDYKAVSERQEKESVEYIDKRLGAAEPSEGADSSGNNSYFDWKSITSSPGAESSLAEADSRGGEELDLGLTENESEEVEFDELKTVTQNLDGTASGEEELGERPVLYGSGLNTELNVEDYAIGVSNGRINEWPVEWAPGKKVLSFFPILIDQYSLNPNPLQIGFEDSIRFRGKHVESIFNSIVDKLGDKEIYGLCFLSPESLQLAPLAVYAELISKKTVVDGSGENLLVTGRVLGRVLINRVVLEEPFIKALVSPYEDDPVLRDPENIPKLVDEIVSLYDGCNSMESEIMQLLEQPYAHTRVKNRTKLFDVIDDRLNKFNIRNDVNQGFAQIAAYAAFDYHLNATERYDALAMQNTEDRLRFVRDTLKFKGKQLNIVKNSPKDRLEDLVKHLKNFQNNRDSLYSMEQPQELNGEDVAVENNQAA